MHAVLPLGAVIEQTKTTVTHMKKNLLCLITAVVALCAAFAACDDDMTYADMLKAENKAIDAFIKKGCKATADNGSSVLLDIKPINVISEAEFLKDSTTDVSKNEYVLFNSTGVYMQIVRKGVGEKIKNGESCQVICRYHEFDISQDSLRSSNRVAAYEQMPDVMSVKNSDGIYSATFTQGLMNQIYGSAVPSGWLIALPFINIGRPVNPDDEIAMVRLIVPSGQGHSGASQGIYACFYELTMMRGR